MRLRNILKICLVFWKSEPQYAYKCYAQLVMLLKKHVVVVVGGEVASLVDDRLVLCGLLGCDPYTARLSATKPLAPLDPSGDGDRYILVFYVLLSGSLPCGIGRPPLAFWNQVFSYRCRVAGLGKLNRLSLRP